MRSQKNSSLCFIISILIGGPLNAQAQAVSSGDSLKLATTLEELLPNIYRDSLKREFESLWNGEGLVLSQKLSLADLFQKLSRHQSEQNDLATIVIYAHKNGNIDSEKFARLLEVCQKLIDQYSPQTTAQVLAALNNFLLHNALYYSNFNQLLFIAGSYDFQFIAPPAEEPVADAPDPEVIEDMDDTNPSEEDPSTWVTDEEGFEISSPDTEEEFSEARVPSVSISGPIITFENTNLIFKTPFDSVPISGAHGNFVMVENIFQGTEGKMDWASVGLSPDSVYCSLNEYRFLVSRPQIAAEGADLVYLGKLKNSAKGSFLFLSSNPGNQRVAHYPQFISDEGTHQLDDLGNDKISLVGGISLEGNLLSTKSKSGAHSTLRGTGRQGANFVAKSQNFLIEDSVIFTTGPAEIAIRQSYDSIYHPGMKLSFYSNSSHLRLTEDKSQFRQSPLIASWFHMDIYSSLIDWDLGSDSIDISILNAKNMLPVTFESHDYFNEARFNSLSGLNDFNPLVSAMGYSRTVNSLEFTSHDLALSIDRDPDIMRSAIIALSYSGYVDYDPISDILHITRKGVHNYLSQRRRRDYDFLSISSVIADRPNATLNLQANEMKIRGVDRIYVSHKQDVFIQPDSSEVTLMANRNFYFHGSVTAGNFQYLGKDFLFDYDSFLVHLPKVEAIRLEDRSASDGNSEKQGLNNQIIESGGVLYINKPNNKSQLKDFPEYPIYTASSGAVFYFNNPEILGGAYDRTVYFTVPPFTLDSVSNSDPSTVSFDGTFHSKMFPDFEQRVTVMPDNSLGFVHNIPEQGYQLYGDRGKLYNIITMDNRGLRSAGTITFNTTTLESTDFTFFLDSVTTRGTLAKVEEASDENYEFPEVSVTDFRMNWLPEKDKMFLSNVGDPFVLFHETASLDGSLAISSHDATGSGTLNTRGSKTVSNQMTLKSDEISAGSARFEIESSDPKKPHLVGNDVTLEFQLANEIAELQLEKAGIPSIDLPYTQIQTSIPNAQWNLAEGKVYLEKSADLDLKKSFIRTTRPELDSLTFQASGAVYDLQDHSLDISGIPFINVADARIKPKGQTLKIFEGATIPRLTEAELIIDTLNRFHRLYDGEIAIISRKAFQGSATYGYTNSRDESFGIQMTDFHLVNNPDESAHVSQYSVSGGVVTEAQQLFISPGVVFKGSVTMHAPTKSLVWDGLVKLDLQGTGGNTWIRYSNKADFRDVVLPLNQSLAENGEALTAGLFLDQQGSLYGSFLSAKRSPSDQPLFIPDGQLFYDQTENRYKIEDHQRTSGESYSNNSFTLDDEKSQLDVDGSFNILPNVTSFGLQASGKGTMNLNSNEFILDALLTIDFEIPDQLLSVLTQKVNQQFELHSKNKIASIDTRKIAQLSGDDAAMEYQKRSAIGSAPLYSISPELNRSFVFSKVDLAWSNRHNAIYSVADLDLANIKKTEISAKVKGYLEIQPGDKPRSVHLFLEMPGNLWYYLSFSGTQLQMLSSDPEFNQGLDDKSKSDKTKAGNFYFESTDLSEAQNFIDRFRRDYLDISAPQILNIQAGE